jgi:general secretion pathway protein I
MTVLPVSDMRRRIRPVENVEMPSMMIGEVFETVKETSYRRPRQISAISAGFTLLEVMIAMAILAIALIAVYQSQSQSVSMAGSSRFLTTASLLAQSRMTEIDMADPRKIENGSGDFGNDFQDYTWQVEIGDTQIDFLKKIVLTVTNNRMADRNTYRVILYKVVLP